MSLEKLFVDYVVHVFVCHIRLCNGKNYSVLQLRIMGAFAADIFKKSFCTLSKGIYYEVGKTSEI